MCSLFKKFGKEECPQTETVTTGIQTILGGTTTLTTLVSDVFDIMVANPLLVIFLASSLIGVGISLFRRLRGASRG